MAVGDTIRLAAGNWLIVKVRDIIKAMELDGWRLEKRTATGHRKFSHPAKPGTNNGTNEILSRLGTSQ